MNMQGMMPDEFMQPVAGFTGAHVYGTMYMRRTIFADLSDTHSKDETGLDRALSQFLGVHMVTPETYSLTAEYSLS